MPKTSEKTKFSMPATIVNDAIAIHIIRATVKPARKPFFASIANNSKKRQVKLKANGKTVVA